MTTTNEIPPYWAYVRAHERSCRPHRPRPPREYAERAHELLPAVRELARMIAKHEQPPVDPDVQIARDILAKAYEDDEQAFTANAVREGGMDGCFEFKAVLRALKYYGPSE